MASTSVTSALPLSVRPSGQVRVPWPWRKSFLYSPSYLEPQRQGKGVIKRRAMHPLSREAGKRNAKKNKKDEDLYFKTAYSWSWIPWGKNKILLGSIANSYRKVSVSNYPSKVCPENYDQPSYPTAGFQSSVLVRFWFRSSFLLGKPTTHHFQTQAFYRKKNKTTTTLTPKR